MNHGPACTVAFAQNHCFVLCHGCICGLHVQAVHVHTTGRSRHGHLPRWSRYIGVWAQHGTQVIANTNESQSRMHPPTHACGPMHAQTLPTLSHPLAHPRTGALTSVHTLHPRAHTHARTHAYTHPSTNFPEFDTSAARGGDLHTLSWRGGVIETTAAALGLQKLGASGLDCGPVVSTLRS
jgi:hypothetical protein